MKPENSLTDLSGKVVTITGGSRGIGKAIALAFSRCGANVVIASRKEENCITLAQHITETTGVEALPVACHVGQWDQCDELFSKVYRHFGKCDVLINNAGIWQKMMQLDGVEKDLIDPIIQTNLSGVIHMTHSALPYMREQDEAAIINVSSKSGVTFQGGQSIYTATKH